MNCWECQHKGCGRTVVGVGGAIGLRAIGWYYQQGPTILCPEHRPSQRHSTAHYLDCTRDDCALCAAEEDAQFYQRLIEPYA